MPLTIRRKVIKRCPEGHVMDLAWRTCPRCTGRAGRRGERDLTDRTMIADAAVEGADETRMFVPGAPAAAAGPSGLARLTVVEGPLQGRDFTVLAGRTKLGKSPVEEPQVTAIALEDPYMSRDHAALQAGVAAVVLVDLGSTNGTYVNGRRVQRAILQTGDEVRLGRTALRVVLASPPGVG